MQPYISLIGFARNDDYVPDRAQRHNYSLNFLISQLEERKIPSEIILVEWNYPEEKPPLATTLKIEHATEWTSLRVIRVPSGFHQKYKFWQSKPFHVGAAVNVGIRRALGKFILPIASDVFLSEACLDFIAQQNLDENSFYRCDRYDIDPIVFNLNQEKNRAQFFELCEKNIRLHHAEIIQDASFCIAKLHTNASGDFCLVPREKLHEIRGFKEGKDVGALDIDSLVVHALDGIGCAQQILSSECKVYKVFHGRSTTRAVRQNSLRPWQKILETAGKCIMGNYKIVNDLRIAFNYPKRQFAYAPDAIFDSFERNFIQPARQWAKKIPPYTLNDENWGLANENLEEFVYKNNCNPCCPH